MWDWHSGMIKTWDLCWWTRAGLVWRKTRKKCVKEKTVQSARTRSSFWKVPCPAKAAKVSFSLKWVCKATSVIYFLRCSKCELGYVGATSRELSKRYSEHVGKIKSSSLEIQTVHLHFKQSEKGCVPQIGILEKVKEETLFEIEKKYI